MLASEKALGFFLWYGLTYAVAGIAGVYSYFKKRSSWYRQSAPDRRPSALRLPENAEKHWPVLYAVGWALLHFLGAYVPWRVFIHTAARTHTLGVALQFVYLVHLGVILITPFLFFGRRSLGWTFLAYLLNILLAGVVLGLFAGLRYASTNGLPIVTAGLMPLIAQAIYTAGLIVPFVMHCVVIYLNSDDRALL